MMATRVLTVEVMVLDEFAEHGLWCDRCLLPSMVKMPYRIVMPASLSVVGRGELLACADCGECRRAS
jgi:hypothetical protein